MSQKPNKHKHKLRVLGGDTGISLRRAGLPAQEEPLQLGLYAPVGNEYAELTEKTIVFLGKRGIAASPLAVAKSVICSHRDIITAQQLINTAGHALRGRLKYCVKNIFSLHARYHTTGMGEVHPVYTLPNPGDPEDDRLVVAYPLGTAPSSPLTVHFRAREKLQRDIRRTMMVEGSIAEDAARSWSPYGVILPVCALENNQDAHVLSEFQRQLGGRALNIRTVSLGEMELVQGPLVQNFLNPAPPNNV